MTFFNKKISPDQLFRILFHFLFWAIWLGWPFMNQSNDSEKERRFIQMVIPVNLLCIPLFLLNSEYLMPKFFKKNKLGFYILLLLILTLIFAYIQFVIKLNYGFAKSGFWAFISIFPPTFISAISLSYGLIIKMNTEERLKQEKDKEKLQSELAFLRSQISPHFIFNVLNSIVYLTNSKPDIARKVTIQLSELIRYMLYESDDSQVTLATEMKYLNNYINLQKIRFEDDVEIFHEEKNYNENLNIEPMLLIPFVENAFKHGVGMCKNPQIFIFSEVKEDTFHFVVKNTKNQVDFEGKELNSGIGLKNVTRRLELLYPNRYTFESFDKSDFYTINLTIKLS